jgi:hypothetical protein
MGTQFNYAGIQHQTLDQYTGVSDLIAKLKNGTPYKAKLFCLITNYFRLYKDSIKISYNLLPKRACIRTTILPFRVCIIYEIIRKEVFFTA